MSKDYLEALDRLYCSGNLQLDYVLSSKHKHDYELLKHAFQSLESIENADPSEALKCLECLYSDPEDYRSNDRAKDYETIKNYILKTQEQKKYLRWEDLDFKKDNQFSYYKVKLGNSVYKVVSYFSYIFNKDTVTIIANNRFNITEQDKQFFNDLHLEMVEE